MANYEKERIPIMVYFLAIFAKKNKRYDAVLYVFLEFVLIQLHVVLATIL